MSILWRIAGFNPAQVRLLHASSRNRATVYGLGILLCSGLWFGSTTLLMWHGFQFELLTALLVACCAAGFIATLDLIVIRLPDCKFCDRARVVLGICIAVLGAINAEMTFFHVEIREQFQQQQKALVDATFATLIEKRAAEVDGAKTRTREHWDKHVCERNPKCPGSSGRGGVGPIAIGHMEQAEREKKTLSDAEAAERATLEDRDRKRRVEAERMPGIGDRVSALASYLRTHPAAIGLYLLVLTLLASVEFVVVGSKRAFGATPDDVADAAREAIAVRRAKDVLLAATSPERRIRLIVGG